MGVIIPGLVDRQMIQMADLLKVMKYLSTSKAATSEEADIRDQLISKSRAYLTKITITNKNTESSTKSPSGWIPIGKAKTPMGVSKISMKAPSQTNLYGDAIRNSIKILLNKENMTTAYLAKLTHIIQIMAKSIIQQQYASQLYDRSQFDSQLRNLTSKIWTLLREMNSTEHKSGLKLYTTGTFIFILVLHIYIQQGRGGGGGVVWQRKDGGCRCLFFFSLPFSSALVSME